MTEARFVVDVHLAALARHLRLFGFDALYRNDYSDEELVRISTRETRILLTRDRDLLKRRHIAQGYLVRDKEPRKQIMEVLERFDLAEAVRPFSRCTVCNETLAPVEKETIEDRLPPKVRQRNREFMMCRGCGRIYWKGTHFAHLADLVSAILEKSSD